MHWRLTRCSAGSNDRERCDRSSEREFRRNNSRFNRNEISIFGRTADLIRFNVDSFGYVQSCEIVAVYRHLCRGFGSNLHCDRGSSFWNEHESCSYPSISDSSTKLDSNLGVFYRATLRDAASSRTLFETQRTKRRALCQTPSSQSQTLHFSLRLSISNSWK